MDVFQSIVNKLQNRRDKAFVQKFYVERKPDVIIMEELFIDSKQTLWRMKKKIKAIVVGYQNETKWKFYVEKVSK